MAASVAEPVDAADLKSASLGSVGSSPTARTIPQSGEEKLDCVGFPAFFHSWLSRNRVMVATQRGLGNDYVGA